MTLGKHCFTEAYGCPFELLNDEQYLKEQIIQSLNKTSLTLLDISSYKFEPQGVTIVALLSESHISIHTWPEEGKAAVDVYTCGDCNPKIGCDIIIQQLYATDHTLSYIER